MNAPKQTASGIWEEVRFRYLADVQKGSLPTSVDESGLNADVSPYLTMEYLRGEVNEPTLVGVGPNVLRASENDTLLLWDGSNAGEFLRAKRGIVSSTTALVTSKSVNPGFLFWACKAQEVKIKAETVGMGIPHVNGEFLSNLPIQIPDPNQQRVIANFLDRETARLDALKEEKERVLELLAEKRRTLITFAVTRGLNSSVRTKCSGVPWLGRVPRHWTQTRLKRLLESMDYGISNSVEAAGNVAVLRMGDVQEGQIDYSNVGFVDEVDASLLLEPGDLVFNRTNSIDQIGKVAIFCGKVDFSVTFASYLVRLRCVPLVLPEFLNWLLNSAYPLAWGRAQALPAIGQANLNPNRYSYLHIALPPIEEQKAIIEFISKWTSRIDVVRLETERTIALLNQRRAALIAAAVTGQLEVT